MNDRRNVIVMFLLIILSFAIITEVSAASEAEIDGTGSNSSMMSDDILKHDLASERTDENQMQDQFDADGFQSRDGQKSFDKTPGDPGDNNGNEILYEHNMDLKPVDGSQDLNQSPEFKLDEMKQLDNMSDGMFDGVKPMDNMSDGMFDDKKPFGHENVTRFMFDVKPMDNSNSSNLRNDNFTNLPINDELMNDVVSNLIGLNNVAPNFKKEDRNVSPNIITNQKQIDDNNNESAPLIPDGKNLSDIGSVNINKNTKSHKEIKKVKTVKKPAKKVKSIKKPKKVNKKTLKKSKKERAKL